MPSHSRSIRAAQNNIIFTRTSIVVVHLRPHNAQSGFDVGERARLTANEKRPIFLKSSMCVIIFIFSSIVCVNRGNVMFRSTCPCNHMWTRRNSRVLNLQQRDGRTLRCIISSLRNSTWIQSEKYTMYKTLVLQVYIFMWTQNTILFKKNNTRARYTLK